MLDCNQYDCYYNHEVYCKISKRINLERFPESMTRNCPEFKKRKKSEEVVERETMINLAGTIKNAVNAYDGVAFEIYLSGCCRACPGCHSPELQDFSYGKELNSRELVAEIKENEDFIDIISVLGGDPLHQDPVDFYYFCLRLRKVFPDKKLWLFTGEDKKWKIPKWCFEMFDVIKMGSYKQEFHQEGMFPASSNQRILRKGENY